VLPGRSAVWVGLGARAPMLPPPPHERARTEFFENRQLVDARRLFRIIRKVSGQALKLLSDSERNRDGGIAVPHHLGSPPWLLQEQEPQARTAFHSL
jgi:hypothetical protein